MCTSGGGGLRLFVRGDEGMCDERSGCLKGCDLGLGGVCVCDGSV